MRVNKHTVKWRERGRREEEAKGEWIMDAWMAEQYYHVGYQLWTKTCILKFALYFIFQPMFSVAPSLATNASAAFNPYLGPVSPSLVPAEILPTAPMLVTGNPGVPVPAAAAAAAQKLMRTDRLEVGVIHWCHYVFHSKFQRVLFVYFFHGHKGWKQCKAEILVQCLEHFSRI